MADSPSDIFSKFNNADVKFGKVHDEHGDEKELTSAGFSVFMESRDRNVRKEAFYALYRQYKSYINTLAASYYGNVKQAVFLQMQEIMSLHFRCICQVHLYRRVCIPIL